MIGLPAVWVGRYPASPAGDPSFGVGRYPASPARDPLSWGRLRLSCALHIIILFRGSLLGGMDARKKALRRRQPRSCRVQAAQTRVAAAGGATAADGAAAVTAAGTAAAAAVAQGEVAGQVPASAPAAAGRGR